MSKMTYTVSSGTLNLTQSNPTWTLLTPSLLRFYFTQVTLNNNYWWWFGSALVINVVTLHASG